MTKSLYVFSAFVYGFVVVFGTDVLLQSVPKFYGAL